MTKDEIQKNSEHWYNKYKDAEKRITDLENKIADLKANCDLAILFVLTSLVIFLIIHKENE